MFTDRWPQRRWRRVPGLGIGGTLPSKPAELDDVFVSAAQGRIWQDCCRGCERHLPSGGVDGARGTFGHVKIAVDCSAGPPRANAVGGPLPGRGLRRAHRPRSGGRLGGDLLVWAPKRERMPYRLRGTAHVLKPRPMEQKLGELIVSRTA